MEAVKSFLRNNKKALSVLLLVLVIVGGLSMIALTRPRGFRIVETNPRLGEVTSLAPFIKLYLNEKIADNGVSIPAQGVVKSHQVSGKTITLTLNALNKGERYTILIDSIKSTAGNVISKKKISFTAKEGDWEGLPEDQKEAVLEIQDEEKPAYADDPILTHLPYETPDYVINALIDRSELKVSVKLTPSFADTLDDGSMDPDTRNQYITSALNYIRSLNLDPAKYNIQVSEVNPYAELQNN